MGFHLAKIINGDLESIIEKLTKQLVAEDFVILTQYEVKKGSKDESKNTFRKYHILSACNTDLAKRVMKTKGKIGVMLPFTIIIEEDINSDIKISTVGPINSKMTNRNQSLDLGTMHVKIKLNKIIKNL